MSEDVGLRHAARQAIRAGKLPNRTPEQTWGGPGTGSACTICDTPVRAGEPELELEYQRRGGSAPDTHHVHARCYAAWELERQRLVLDGARTGLPADPDLGDIPAPESGRNNRPERA